MHPILRLFCLVLLLAIAADVPAAGPDTDPFARDLLILSEWFEGEFDNEEQVWFQADARSNTPEQERHERIHTTHRRLALPSFGEHVFYVEEYSNNDPTEIVRQRFVIFSTDQEAGAIRMQQGFFRDAQRFRGARADSQALSKLVPADVFFLNECDVYWRRVADQFEGGMRPKSCVFGEGDVRRYSVHKLILSATKYWRVDSTFLVSDDSLHVGQPVDKPYEMRRSKQFLCNVIFRSDDGSSQEIEGLPLHSQGGSFHVKRDSDAAEFTVLMRDKEYPFYSTRPDFIYFSVRKKGENRSIAFTVNDPLSRRLGVSVNGLIAHCYRAGYNFRELYETLK